MGEWVKSVAKNQIIMLIAGILIGVVLCIVFWRPSSDSTVAVVDGKAIKQSEIYKIMREKSGGTTLERLIDNMLVENAAAKYGINVSKEELEKELKWKIDMEYHSEKAFLDSLTALNMTLGEAKEELRLAMLFDRIAVKDVKVTDEDVQKYYTQNKSKFIRPESRRIREIVLKTEAEANAAREQLLGGADFAGLVQQKSTGLDIDKGGDRGFIVKGTLNPVDPEVEKVAFNLKQGEISQAIKGSDGFHIIRVEEVVSEVDPDYNQIKDSVILKAKLEKSRPFTDILNELRNEGRASIKDPEYRRLMEKK